MQIKTEKPINNVIYFASGWSIIFSHSILNFQIKNLSKLPLEINDVFELLWYCKVEMSVGHQKIQNMSQSLNLINENIKKICQI